MGDKIIITAMDGTSKEYTVYDKFTTTAEDVSYLKREIGELPEITLQSCTDDDENRLIILARWKIRKRKLLRIFFIYYGLAASISATAAA